MGFQFILEATKDERLPRRGEVFKAKQAVLWGWNAEMSTLLSKRVCIRKRGWNNHRELLSKGADGQKVWFWRGVVG